MKLFVASALVVDALSVVSFDIDRALLGLTTDWLSGYLLLSRTTRSGALNRSVVDCIGPMPHSLHLLVVIIDYLCQVWLLSSQCAVLVADNR